VSPATQLATAVPATLCWTALVALCLGVGSALGTLVWVAPGWERRIRDAVWIAARIPRLLIALPLALGLALALDLDLQQPLAPVVAGTALGLALAPGLAAALLSAWSRLAPSLVDTALALGARRAQILRHLVLRCAGSDLLAEGLQSAGTALVGTLLIELARRALYVSNTGAPVRSLLADPVTWQSSALALLLGGLALWLLRPARLRVPPRSWTLEACNDRSP